jgi:hypothetical protein
MIEVGDKELLLIIDEFDISNLSDLILTPSVGFNSFSN